MVEGKIVIDSKANAWAHELKTAKVLASKGHDVFFPAESTEEHMKSPDIIFLGIPWEIKAPRSPQIAKVLKVVREALHQAPNVIYDSQRVKSLSDSVTIFRVHLFATAGWSSGPLLRAPHKVVDGHAVEIGHQSQDGSGGFPLAPLVSDIGIQREPHFLHQAFL